MSRKRRWLLVAVASGTVLVLVAGIATFYVDDPPTFLIDLLARPISEPTREEYQAYSGFVDDLFSSKHPFNVPQLGPGQAVNVFKQTTKFIPQSVPPLDVALLGPGDMARDFYRQNSRSWELEPEFYSKRAVTLVGQDTARSAVRWDSKICVLSLSRIGFNRRHSLALLSYSYRCGNLCCESGWTTLKNTGDGWSIKEYGGGVIY